MTRLAVLEEKQIRMQEDLAAVRMQVSEIHSFMMQAKGARWALIGLAGLGGAVSGFIVKLLPFFSMRPPS